MQSFARSLSFTTALVLAVVVGLLLAAAAQEQRPPEQPGRMVLAPPPSNLAPAIRGGKSDAAPPAPISFADPDGQELVLEEMSARTAIHGMLSLTELELRFRNPQPRRIEGRFSCTLPPNAAISRFAKEINGQLMEGEVVERLRANQVYEQFLHQMRDPALLEQDQGNRFSARIFPIDANAPVRLLLSYTTLLPLRDGTRTYTLPLRGMSKIGKLTFRAFVTPIPTDGPNGELTTSTAEVTKFDQEAWTPDRDLVLTSRSDASGPMLLRAGDFYLAALRPNVAAAQGQTQTSRWLFYVDTSASSAEGAPHRVRALEALFAALPASDDVEVLTFDNEVVPLAHGSAAELSHSIGDLLRARLFLGGTDVEAMLRDLTKRAEKDPSRTAVIASDLVATLGSVAANELQDAIAKLPANARVHALVLGSREDAAMAKAITARHGRVVRVPFTDALVSRAAAAAAELRRPLGGSVDFVDAGAEWVYPTHVDDVAPGDEVLVLGKVKAGEQPRIVPARAERLEASTFAPLLEREAYRAYLEYLAMREANEPAEAVRRALATEQVKISIEQRVVIPRTTMLVLESEWDYQRFGLDRRALAQILTIEAGGIGRLDRARTTFAPPPPVVAQKAMTAPPAGAMRREARTAAAPAGAVAPEPPPVEVDETWTTATMQSEGRYSQDVEGGVAGGVEGGVVGGVVGGVAGGVIDGVVSVRETMMVAGEPERQNAADARSAQAISVTANAPVVADAPRMVAETIAAPPPPPPAARRIAQPPGRGEGDWTAQQKPPRAGIAELQAKLDAQLHGAPQDRELYNQLSETLAAYGEWSSLRRVALQWQPYDPENPQVYEVLGMAAEELGRQDEAARAFASLIEIAPAKTELLQRAGLLLLRTNSAKLAETPLRKALEARPDRANGYRHLALMLWHEGRTEEAAHVLEAATRQQFPQWYGGVQRVIHEELGYVYRAWMRVAPERSAEIANRAREYDVDLERRDALRVTLAWETDANDVDLHVVDPDGEECFYSHKSTRAGLELYEDITQGLGPEVIRDEQAGSRHVPHRRALLRRRPDGHQPRPGSGGAQRRPGGDPPVPVDAGRRGHPVCGGGGGEVGRGRGGRAA
jgi:tetratricopeptide (TPR) repeat protein